jgi:hypothetical protein
MTRHQTAILLAIGWALLLPQWEESGSQTPTARWQHAGSFDSAEECEAVRAELIDAARRPFGDPWMIPDLGDRAQVEQKISWADSRCRPCNDPLIGPRCTR